MSIEQKLAYGGNPVLRWMMDNIFIRTDPAGNIKADKEKSTEKIWESAQSKLKSQAKKYEHTQKRKDCKTHLLIGY